MVVGIITARGGSRGIPGKNMVDLGGKPLIAYSFDVAQACRGLDQVYLTTDIPEAIQLAKASYPKIKAPFVRPANLCRDETSQVEVVSHLIKFISGDGRPAPDAIVLLQPTSPFRKASEINAAITLFQEKRLDSLMGVARVAHHPADYLYRDEADPSRFRWVMRSERWTRRQEFPEVFFNTGALYVCRSDYFSKHRRFFDETSHLFPMSQPTLIDIDTEFDLLLARGLLIASTEPLC